MLAKPQAGGTCWDVLVPTNYTFETYGKLKLLEPLDLTKIPASTRAGTRHAS